MTLLSVENVVARESKSSRLYTEQYLRKPMSESLCRRIRALGRCFEDAPL